MIVFFFSFLLTRIEYFLYFFVFVLFAFVFCWYFPFSFFFFLQCWLVRCPTIYGPQPRVFIVAVPTPPLLVSTVPRHCHTYRWGNRSRRRRSRGCPDNNCSSNANSRYLNSSSSCRSSPNDSKKGKWWFGWSSSTMSQIQRYLTDSYTSCSLQILLSPWSN